MKKPDVFRYHDYLAFMKDWLAYQKASQASFSLRGLALKAGLASGYLPMMLGGKRPLTGKALSKLLPHLGLPANEKSFLETLLVLGTSDSSAARMEALDKMKRFKQYQRHNQREAEVYEYLTHWYYVAIREMAALPGFKLDPSWIQEHLRVAVPLQEIKSAVEFLLGNGFLKADNAGGANPPEKSLECVGGVYRVALGEYHRELLELAARSIENTSSEHRDILGHTFPINEKDYGKARAIVEDALKQIRELGALEKNADSVYHLELALFPLTSRRDRK